MKASEQQIGGNHYQHMKIKPTEFILANNIPFLEGNVIKYVCRHKHKNGKEDIEKAIHYLQLLLEHEYHEENLVIGKETMTSGFACGNLKEGSLVYIEGGEIKNAEGKKEKCINYEDCGDDMQDWLLKNGYTL